MPFKTWVERITSDEVAKQFFAAAASVIMMFPPEFAYQKASTQLMTTSFMAHLCGGRSNLMVMVGDTSDALPKAFCNVATKNGGQVLINHKVSRVIVEGGKAKGVVVRNADGVEETYNAKYVIMSSSYPTFKPLLGKNMPGEITEIIKDFDTVDYTLIEVDLGLKRQMAYPWWALVTVLKDDFGYEGAIMANSHYVPTLVPPGKELIQAATFLPTVDYREANKKELVQKVIDMCERVYPGMKDEVEMTSVYVLSPTFHYTYLPGRKVPLECPGISGLYFVGDCTESPGFTTERCASSAMTVAKNILRRGGN
jgi:phytoene dehydrogenase-like protein